MKTCPKCSTENPGEAKFCLTCGTKFETSIVCPKCSTIIPENAVFCLNCGHNLAKTNELIEQLDNRKKSSAKPQKSESKESPSVYALLQKAEDAESRNDYPTAIVEINKALEISPYQVELWFYKARVLSLRIHQNAISQKVSTLDIKALDEIQISIKKAIDIGCKDQTIIDKTIETIAQDFYDYLSLLFAVKKLSLSYNNTKESIEQYFSTNELPEVFRFIRFLWESSKTKAIALDIKTILELIVDFYDKFLLEYPDYFDMAIIKNSLGDITKEIKTLFPNLGDEQKEVIEENKAKAPNGRAPSGNVRTGKTPTGNISTGKKIISLVFLIAIVFACIKIRGCWVDFSSYMKATYTPLPTSTPNSTQIAIASTQVFSATGSRQIKSWVDDCKKLTEAQRTKYKPMTSLANKEVIWGGTVHEVESSDDTGILEALINIGIVTTDVIFGTNTNLEEETTYKVWLWMHDGEDIYVRNVPESLALSLTNGDFFKFTGIILENGMSDQACIFGDVLYIGQ